MKLPEFTAQYATQGALAASEGWGYDQYLLRLCELELDQRESRKRQKLLAASRLPREKRLENFERSRLKRSVERQFSALLDGDFLRRAENVLVFGSPGGGKTHLLAALGHQLVEQGHSVLFTTCVLLVQRLLQAKQELLLEKELKRLDKYEALIIDDIGYVQQSREEMEVLFTLLAHRYEGRSVLLTSNLVFSEWERIFKDPMTTAAAIDRLVHHSVILELNLPSYRMEAAQNRKSAASADSLAD
ncbi:IS21-like element helper ATPase IstB [Shinella sp.]|uniref:IS21-like element helper ATPase IstB n=1 Tax=Shinella sp. TaxID=1870904 RepID=UPI00258E21B1|nr:IS21-like element helper ATPase IstB [Shinella sp.]